MKAAEAGGAPPLTVGVLGGMGPEATLDFFARVLRLTPAARDQEHLRLVIDNNPRVPDRNEAVAGRGPSPAGVLASMARGLEAAGADFLVMPCNAAHAFADAVRSAAGIPLLSIVDEAAGQALASRPGVARVGVLASTGCLDAGLYRHALERAGVETIEPRGRQRDDFMALLYRVKGGDRSEGLRAAMRHLAASLVAAGAEAVIAGCTEVPLVLGRGDLEVPLIDSTEALAEATVACALGRRPLPEAPR